MKQAEGLLKWQTFKDTVCSMLNHGGEIAEDENLLHMGLSSIQIMKLINLSKKLGYRLTFEQLVKNPYLKEWQPLFMNEAFIQEQMACRVEIEDVDMYQPFPLTEVQHAYWIGRYDGQYLGNVGCHGYLEVNVQHIDTERLASAWKKLQEHHPMLRSIFTADGKQYILKKSQVRPLIIHDYRTANNHQIQEHLEEMRHQTSHRLLKIEEGQVAELQITLLPDNKGRLFFDIDLLVADVQSYQILLRDLVAIYNRNVQPQAPLGWNFATYLVEKDEEQKNERNEAKAYWTKRLATLPTKPLLPVANKSEIRPLFNRRSFFLSAELWKKLQHLSSKSGVTPAMVLLTIYSLVLNKWSENDHFLINIPLFNRQSSDKFNIEEVVADFTTLLLLEVDLKEPRPFLQDIQAIQAQFHQDMQYTSYSGIDVQRDFIRQHGSEQQIAPVVFSCNIGTPLLNEEFTEVFGDIHYMISQTPQVWLDFQVFEQDNGLLLIWDSLDDIFKPHILDDMFASFKQTVEYICHTEDWSSPLLVPITDQLNVRNNVLTQLEIEPTCLHAPFFEHAQRSPNDVALIFPAANMLCTYGLLQEKALSIAQYLKNNGIKKGDAVGILMERGIQQIATILGILAAGAVYVPISLKQPLSRRSKIYQAADICVVVTDQPQLENGSGISFLSVTDAEQCCQSVEISYDPASTAYIIFTSGSTGVPKGVEMTHEAAWNTIYAVNQLQQIDASDSVLAVSATEFDLSVYDMFGLLAVGGKLILLNEHEVRTADKWVKYVEEFNITVWNSAPILFEMLCAELEHEGKILSSVRYVYLSGDWIKPDLVKQMQIKTPNSTLIAMGGATEGGIWSNYYQITNDEACELSSIPYGYPLPNQAYRVVNERGEDCPNQVAGELWIGGKSIAVGYKGNEQQTKSQFVYIDGEKWYKTGDFGKYSEDGILEFLGRKDEQIKVNGHRIELGEIERSLKGNKGIKDAVVLANQQKNANTLHAFITADSFGDIFDIHSTSSDIPKLIQNVMEVISESFSVDARSCSKTIQHFRTEIEQLTCYGITFILQQAGFPMKQGDVYHLQQLLEENNIDARYYALFHQWFGFLHQLQLVTTADMVIYENTCDLSDCKMPLLENYPRIKQFGTAFIGSGQAIIQGEVAPATLLFSEDTLTPMEVISEEPGAKESNQVLATIIHMLSSAKNKWKRPLQILELGARGSSLTKAIVKQLTGINYHYTITDTSMYFKNKFEKILSDTIEYKTLDIDIDPILQGYQRNHYDIIIANNALHRVKNLPKAMRLMEQLLDADGLMVVTENTQNNSLQLITTGFEEQGFTQFEDNRKDVCQPLLSDEQWLDVFSESAYANVKVINHPQLYAHHIFLAQPSPVKIQLNQKQLESYLREQLPDYMIPKNVTMLLEMPVTNNGKLDRKLLRTSINTGVHEQVEPTRSMNALEQKIANIWQDVLDKSPISLEDNFYQLGGDSLIATQLNSQLQKNLNIPISLETIFKYPIFGDFANYVSGHLQIVETSNADSKLTSFAAIQCDTDHLYDPFPLTDIQQSYWLGRSGVYDLSDVSAHCYFELECDELDMATVTAAWNQLIQRHDIMRAVVLDNGLSQKIIKEVPYYQIKINVYKYQDQVAFEKGVLSTRNKMSQRQFDVSKWPLFAIEASLSHDQKTRLHVSFDNTVFDGYSIFLLFDEWYKLYNAPALTLPMINISFRDYAIALADLKKSSQYKKDMDYWEARIQKLPPAPELPIEKQPHDIAEQKFTRYQAMLSKDKWTAIKQMAYQLKLTPSNVIMTAYAEVLGRYSRHQHFTLNLTHFNRLPLHEDVDKLVGDFTSLVLVEIDHRHESNFIMRCQDTQRQLLQDLEHTLVSGVEVERMLRKGKNTQFNDIVMPIVFTSGIGVNKDHLEDISYLGKIVYGASQTPQVWLDHQVFEQDGELILSWDGIEALFPTGLLNEMFHAYIQLLDKLSQGIEAWQQSSFLIVLPDAKQREAIHQAAIIPLSEETLVSLIEKQCIENRKNTAIIAPSATISYEELDTMSKNIAYSVSPGQAQVIVVLIEKDWQQIVAALGIMRAGIAYLPVDIDTPMERLHQIIQQAQVDSVMTTQSLASRYSNLGMNIYIVEELIATNKDKPSIFRDVKPVDLAYIIFTSGSTGKPKGVEITHRSVVNTILDINKRFDVTDSDRSIALSNFTFDLSIYDIFGLLSVGGAVVIPEIQRLKDPEHWLDMLHKHHITIWNTVPTFMEMLVDYHKTARTIAERGHDLKAVLLSGDWIPLTLPEKIKNIFEGANVISLGGATECSIWSNYYIINTVQESWKSIPYGKSLSHQQLYVLNKNYEDCPVWVKGDLYIGGIGLSVGYCHDPERTKAHYIHHPITGERIYKTGDLARFLPDGNIEFLGREDQQVKINGHRVELGDIEANLCKFPIIQQAVVTMQEQKLIGHLKLYEHIQHELIQTIATDINLVKSIEIIKKELAHSTANLRINQLADYTQSIEWLSVGTMFLDLYALTIFKAEGQVFIKEDIMRSVANVYASLMEHWLDYLVHYGFVEKRASSYIVNFSENGALNYINHQLNDFNLDEMKQTLQQLREQLITSRSARLAILKGEQSAKAYLLDSQGFLTPEQLGQYNLWSRHTEKLVEHMLATLAKSDTNQALNVLELGTRTGHGTDNFAKVFKNAGQYTYCDESSDFINWKKASTTQEHIKFKQFDVNIPPDNQQCVLHDYDIIIAENTLHRSHHLNNTMAYLKRLLKPGGLIILTENVKNNALLLITVAFFEEGYHQLRDFRCTEKLPLLNREAWQSLMKDEGYTCLLEWPQSDSKWLGEHIMIAGGPAQIKSLSVEQFAEEVKNTIPKYMCPDHYFVHERFPITANGKLDRKQLAQYQTFHQPDIVEQGRLAVTLEEQAIVKVWNEILETEYRSIKDNFFEQGGDSLKAIRFINKLDEQGYVLTLEKLFLHPTIEGLALNLEEKKDEQDKEEAQVTGSL
ncbi:amino acid adenylation domain-containing protein [Lysinibacillus sp. FSL H8-0500]|uniref:amino acid adenylation domain-containing protein n=1 Tax=Lysinibacillus sp. FSL H8-0500 TaxID=2921393 RepID=UPI003100FB64